MRVVISDKARADLRRIYRYLDERSSGAANAFLHRVDLNFENLMRFPFIGRERSSLAPGLRCLVVGLYLVFYTVQPIKSLSCALSTDEWMSTKNFIDE